MKFQYRKRYEITCDAAPAVAPVAAMPFQYRKRYEITCDIHTNLLIHRLLARFNTASGMRSHVTKCFYSKGEIKMCFNTASGMRSHVTLNMRKIK